MAKRDTSYRSYTIPESEEKTANRNQAHADWLAVNESKGLHRKETARLNTLEKFRSGFVPDGKNIGSLKIETMAQLGFDPNNTIHANRFRAIFTDGGGFKAQVEHWYKQYLEDSESKPTDLSHLT